MCKGFIRVLCCLIIITLNININVSAQQIVDLNNFTLRNINDGLSQISVEDIFQDSNGYIWIGTRDGLNRYNGHEIKVYRKNKKDENSLSGNSITVIKEDFKGNIWVGTSTGLNKINISNNSVTRYLPNENECNISHYRIRDILIGEDGEILVATNDGLNIYDEKEDNFTRIYDEGYEKGEISNQIVNSLEQDSDGNYWVGTNNGLNKICRNDGQVIKYFKEGEDDNSISGNYISSLYYDDKGELWVGTCYLGLNKMDLNTGRVESFFSSNESTSIPGAYIKDIFKNSSGEVWIVTEAGIAVYDKKNNIFNREKSYKYDFSKIISNETNTVFEDKSGMMWVGTTGGISTYNKSNEFKSYSVDESTINSVTDKYISGIYEDNSGLLWIGTMLDGISLIDRESGEVKRIDHNLDYDNEPVICNNMVREITGIDNEVWIATQNGLNLYNKDTNKMSIFNESDGLASNDVLSLLVDDNGVLWIGTYYGLSSYDRNGNMVNYNEILLESGITAGPITDIHQDKDGDIWFAANIDNGLIRYTNGDFQKYNLSSDKKFYSKIYSINSSDDNYIWLGTDSGLMKLDKSNNHINIYNEWDGMNNSFIYGILIDEYENLWFSTNNGILKFDMENNKFVNFNIDDGLQSKEFNQYSYYKSKSGEMFFGGINGFTSFYPKDIKIKNYIPKVQIDEFICGDSTLYEKENNTVNLDYKENTIEFEFFLPDYSSSNIQYFYMLDGVDDNWINSGGRNHANYININPGKYIFRVCARNSKGDFSEETNINLIVKPPIYKTTLAYFIYFGVFLAIVYIIWNRVKILDKLVAQKTIELNKKLIENEELYKQLLANEKYKNNYFVNLSHELRTPLNLIVSTQHLVDNLNRGEKGISREKISYYMNTIKRNSNRLIRLIDNIINTSKIEAGNYKLNIGEYDIVYLVEELALSMKDYIEEKGLQLIIDPDVEEKIIQCDCSDIEKIIMNLISNAVKFTKAGGTIEIKIMEYYECVKIIVKDTGIGIDRSKHKAIFNRFDQAYESTSEEFGGSGLGLTLSKQLVELHGGSIDIESEVGKGSEFTVILPVKQKKFIKEYTS